MPNREPESDPDSNDSVLSNSLSADDFSQNLLRETNKNFEDWLGNSGNSHSEFNGEQSLDTSPGYLPKEPRGISFEGSLSVDGYMAGQVRSAQGTLIVSQGGEIDGDITVNVAVIHGSVRGDIRATMKVELGSSARVIGDIETVELAIRSGAVFEGRCALLSVTKSTNTQDTDHSPPAEPSTGASTLSSAAAAG